MSGDPWNRCDICGKFIPIEDFPDKATRLLIRPDSEFSKEEYDTYHNKCLAKWREERGR